MHQATCTRCGDRLPAGYDAARPCPRCLFDPGIGSDSAPNVFTRGAFVPPLEPEELAPHFPDLEIEEVLGQGGMGVVYRARQKRLQRDVALKVLRPGVNDPSFGERFLREAQALARLSHPHIVGVYDFGRAGEHLYLVMELVEGANLRRLLHSKAVSTRQALAIVSQVCEALTFAHEHGVVHRDIKPENVLLDRAGNVKIADFGLAKLAHDGGSIGLTQSHQAMGTPHYMAPEQIERPQTVDHRADLYSLGVVLYELLTGELPIGRFAAPSKKVEIDVRLDEVVLRTLEKEPEARYQQASQLRTDLEHISHTRAPRRNPLCRTRSGMSWLLGDRPREGRRHARASRRQERVPEGAPAPRRGSAWPLWVLVAVFFTCVPLACLGSVLAFSAGRVEQAVEPERTIPAEVLQVPAEPELPAPALGAGD